MSIEKINDIIFLRINFLSCSQHSPETWHDIILSQKGNLEMIKRYHQHFSDAIELLENSDREEFIKRFESVTNWMGDYSQLFLDESRVMLQQAHDKRHYEDK